MLDDPDVDLVSKALVRDTLAWWYVMNGGAEDLTQADRLSAEAYQDLPWLSHVKGCRGCVLIEVGCALEGVSLVESALQCEQETWRKAFYLCYLAIAAAAVGGIARAAHYLDEARTLDPHCRFLNRATARIQGNTSS